MMFCPKCGKFSPDDTVFCPECGTLLKVSESDGTYNSTGANTEGVPAQPGYEAPFVPNCFDIMKKVFSSGLCLALCIVVTASAAAGIFGGSISLYPVLAAIAGWLIYTNAKSDAPLKQGGYKLLWITAKIMYIVNWVLLGVTAAAGAILSAITIGAPEVFVKAINEVIANHPYEMEEWAKAIRDISEELNLGLTDISGNITQAIDSHVVVMAGIAITVAVAISIAFILIWNLCFVKHFVKYTKSLSDAFVCGECSVYNKGISVRLLIIGSFTAANLFGGFFIAIASNRLLALGIAANIAVPFMAYALINNGKQDR